LFVTLGEPDIEILDAGGERKHGISPILRCVREESELRPLFVWPSTDLPAIFLVAL
jgi:hypothetical protein